MAPDHRLGIRRIEGAAQQSKNNRTLPQIHGIILTQEPHNKKAASRRNDTRPLPTVRCAEEDFRTGGFGFIQITDLHRSR